VASRLGDFCGGERLVYESSIFLRGSERDNFIVVLARTFRLVESGSFTKASRMVFRSQGAVSMQVKRLEESIGQPLFVRDTRNLELGLARLHPSADLLRG
jgi:Bacterial regulatory helix-turn-helix protein, lysR family